MMSDIGRKQPLIISAKIQNEEYVSTLIQQIGHIKIVYSTNKFLEAKAYYGARLFGIDKNQYTKMIK